ncbi:hypothetical protein PVT67_14025 [Gallaecimonas kandeliae]|uniref:hypothetical protein n=1 Tax=Gallaecimonas kandeliae TaxID=3029055 RepID=UPI0026472B73|nr:hypothetical protein [Gallaecimonas kandeliae]WKE64772.1 hypothetical protein PVT67_14025 [Gallaecimonas kandeliae]
MLKRLCLLLLLVQHCALATEWDTRLRAQERAERASGSALFPAESGQSQFAALDLGVKSQGIGLAATAWYQNQGSGSDADLELAELFYDFSIDDWFVSAGKKKLDWGVGYGFRPLDLFSPTDPLALYTSVAPGSWQLSADRFDDDGNWTWVCNQSRPYYHAPGRQPQGNGCGLRRYSDLGGWELQYLAHYDSKLKWRLGGSAVTVLSDRLEFHGSLLWQQAYQVADFHPERLAADTFINPVVSADKRGAWQGLVGLNYSTDWGATLILEYWYDGRSPSDRDWKEMLARPGQASPFRAYQLMAERQMFASQNLFRNTLMLHLRSSGEHWRPELTMLLDPIDKGLSIHGKVCYYFASGDKLELGAKHYLGAADSVYRQLDFETTYYLGVELVF